MARRMPRRLVALSATAVAAVYFAGLSTTRVADARLASPGAVTSTATPLPTATAAGVPSRSTSPAAPRSTAPTPVASVPTPAATAGLRDGSYTGSGNSRRGGVDVSVTISGGHIDAVTITGGSTQYPLSRIAALPAEVVARQSASVDRVTGATYSMQAFQQAVQQALARAGAGSAGTASSVGATSGAAPVAPAPALQPSAPANQTSPDAPRRPARSRS